MLCGELKTDPAAELRQSYINLLFRTRRVWEKFVCHDTPLKKLKRIHSVLDLGADAVNGGV